MLERIKALETIEPAERESKLYILTIGKLTSHCFLSYLTSYHQTFYGLSLTFFRGHAVFGFYGMLS